MYYRPKSERSKRAMMKEDRRNRKRKRGKRRQKPAASPPPPSGDDASFAKHKSGNSSSVSALQSKTISKPNKTSSFIDKMRARLSGGHFRMINEKLYTCSGDEALNYFKQDPQLFSVDFSNKMFVLLHFKKKDKQKLQGREIDWPELKPCIYKRR
nr:ribosomal RNA-processing protein 8 [Ipomoea batatas]